MSDQQNPAPGAGTAQQPSSPAPRKDHGGLIGGLVMIILGLLFLANNLFPEFSFGDYWPLILIAVGIGLLLKNRRGE
jgi:phage shock protein C